MDVVLGSALLLLAQTLDVKVDDPMLAPVAPPPKTVGSWQEAAATIRERSTELMIARGTVTRAEGTSRIALAGMLPTINATVTPTYNLITNTGTSFFGVTPITMKFPQESFANGSVLLSQPLIAPRAIWNIGTARASEESARLTAADTRRTVTLNVANAMVTVFTNERVAELNRQGLRAALERLDIATRRQAGGAITGLDVIRARQDVETARALIVSGDEQLRQSREALGLALGLPSQVGLGSAFGASSLEEGVRAACKPAESLDQRTDVAASRQQLVVAKRAITDVWLQFSPTLTAQSTVSTTTLNTGVSPNTTWNIQAILSIPVWDGGARYGALRDAHGQVEQAEGRLEQTTRVATVQVAQAARGVEVAEQALEVATRARDLAAEVDRLVRRAFAEGSGTSLELVTAADALRRAEITRALREFDVLRSHVTAALAVANCDY